MCRHFPGKILASEPIEHRRRSGVSRDRGRDKIGQVRHAPLKARGAAETAASKHLEYMDTLNNALTCLVFVPMSPLRYTTRLPAWLKIFV